MERSMSFSSVNESSVLEDTHSVQGENSDSGDVLGEVLGNRYEQGLFGALYTIAKERKPAKWYVVVAAILLDFFQVLQFTLDPSLEWNGTIDWIYDKIRYLQFSNPVISLGFNFYLAVFTFLCAVLVLSLAVCTMVAENFHSNRFTAVWPIKFVRVFFSVFLSVFYISTLKIFLVTLDCMGTDGAWVFSQLRCWETSHIILASVGATFVVIFALTAIFVGLVSFEPDPNTADLTGTAVARSTVTDVLMKTVMTLAAVLLKGRGNWESFTYLATNAILLYNVVLLVPYANNRTNYFRCGLYTMSVWSAGVLFIRKMWLPNAANVPLLSTVLIVGLLPMYGIGHAIAYVRLGSLSGVRMLKLKSAEPLEYEVVGEFVSPRHPEVAIRFVRYEMDKPHIVVAGEALLKKAIEQYPEDSFVHLTYCNYLLAFNKQLSDKAHVMLDLSRRMHPPFVDRFCIFMRDRERLQKVQAQTSGETTMDLVSYIEFQTKFKTALQSFRATLRSIRRFWAFVNTKGVTLQHLSKSFEDIENHQNRATKTYRSLLENYPKSVTALRSYGYFCDEVKGDHASAKRYFTEADKQEAAAAEMRRKKTTEDGSKDGKSMANVVDDKTDATIVCDANGLITFVNNVTAKVTGWKRDELLGRNVSCLVPPPICDQHDGYLRRYRETGQSNLLGTVRVMEVRHKLGHLISARIGVTRIDTGTGMTFMAVIHPITNDDAAQVTINSYGILLSVNKVALRMFGYKAASDVLGLNVQAMMPPNIDHDSYLRRRRETGIDRVVGVKNRRLLGKRADGSFFPLSIDLTRQGDDPETMTFTGYIHELNTGMGLITIDGEGIIEHVNKHCASIFGYDETEMVGKNVTLLMPYPYKDFHASYMKKYAQSGKSLMLGNKRTVMASHHDGSLFPIHLEISETQDPKSGKVSYVARFTSEDPEASAAGGAAEATVGQSSDATLTVSADGRVSVADGATTFLFGRAKEHMSGSSVHTLFAEKLDAREVAGKSAGVLANIVGSDKQLTLCVVQSREQSPNWVLSVRACSTLEALIGVDSSGILVYSSADAGILFGYAATYLRSVHLSELLPILSSNALEEMLQGRGPYTRQGDAVRSDGTLVSVGMEISKLHSSANTFEGATLVLRVFGRKNHGTGVSPRKSEVSPRTNLRRVRFQPEFLHDESVSAKKVYPKEHLKLIKEVKENEDESTTEDAAKGGSEQQTKKTWSWQSEISEQDLGMEASSPSASSNSDSEPSSRGFAEGEERMGSEDTVPAGQPNIRRTFSPSHFVDLMPLQSSDGKLLLSPLVSPAAQQSNLDWVPNKGTVVSSFSSLDSSADRLARAFAAPKNVSVTLQNNFVSRNGDDNDDDDATVDADAASVGSASSNMTSRRSKRVAKILKSNKIRRSLKVLKTRMSIGIMFAVAVHIAIFASMRVEVNRHVGANNRLVFTGEASAALHRVCFGARTLKERPDTPEAVAAVGMVVAQSALLESRMQNLYLSGSASSAVRSLYESVPLVLYQWLETYPSNYMTESLDLWDATRKFVTAGKQIASFPNATLLGGTYNSSKYWRFVIDNGPLTLGDMLDQVLATEKDEWVSGIGRLSAMQGCLMAAELVIIVLLWVLYLQPMVREVFNDRVRLFSYFLAIPKSVVRRLATQTINVHEDEEDEEDGASSDDEDRAALKNKNKKKDETGRAASPLPTYAAMHQDRGGKGGQVEAESPGIFSPAAAPSASIFRRVLGVTNFISALRQKLRGGAVHPEETEMTGVAAGGWIAGRPIARQNAREVDGTQDGMAVLAEGEDRNRYIFLSPMVISSVLLLIAIGVGVAAIRSSRDPSIDIWYSASLGALARRAQFDALELVTRAAFYNPSELAQARSNLLKTVSKIAATHNALREHSTFRNKRLSSLLYDPKQCLRTTSPCRSETDPLYQRTSNGLHVLLDSFLEECGTLGKESVSMLSTSHPSFKFVESVGDTDLADGLATAVSIVHDESTQLIPADVILQSLIFVAVFLDITILSSLVYRPFVRVTTMESRRAAVMLATLPDYVDLDAILKDKGEN